MDKLDIERVGGHAGFGGPHLKSRGKVALSALCLADQRTVAALFAHPPADPPRPDEFCYRLTRQTANGPQTVQIPERHVPTAVRSAVKDELV